LDIEDNVLDGLETVLEIVLRFLELIDFILTRSDDLVKLLMVFLVLIFWIKRTGFESNNIGG